MPYCPKCGIQIEPYRPYCPLCQFPIPVVDEPAEEDPQLREKHLLNRYRIKKAENRKHWREARVFVYVGITFSLFVLSLIFSIQDFYFSGSLSWSRYAVTSNFAVIVSLFFILRFIPAFFPNFIGLSLTAGLFLYILDNLNSRIDWFWDLGLVLCVNTMVWVLILRQVLLHSRRRGLNLPAYVLFAVGLSFYSLEVVRNLYQGREPVFSMGWSVPIVLTLIPLGGLLMLLHFLLSPRIRDVFKRKFHL